MCCADIQKDKGYAACADLSAPEPNRHEKDHFMFDWKL